MHQTLLKAIIGMVCAGALISIAQLWAVFLPWDIFFKALITLAILIVLAAFILVVKSEFSLKKKMKDENFID